MPEVNVNRLLSTSIGQLLGVGFQLDLYVRNPFRLVGSVACAEDKQLAAKRQRCINLYRLNPDAALCKCN